MNFKNVEYTDCKNYTESLIKSLSNFCNKCPLKPIVKVIKDMNLIYVYYNDKELEIEINPNVDKKVVIGEVKKQLEEFYPIIYQKTNCVPNAEDVRKILAQGKTLEEALNSTQVKYKPLYKVERIHDKYNEMDCLSLEDNEMYKFKCKIPIFAILKDIDYLGKDCDVLNNISLLYKINKSNS